jgi:enamine deaminase RidA (YjgF/YER057c/UK114 family)
MTEGKTGARVLEPSGWARPRGYSNGIAARGTLVFVAGQVGWDAERRFADGFVAQARKALENIVAVLKEADAKPEHICRMTWYFADMALYKASLRELGEAYKAVIGAHYPAMTVMQVVRLDEPEALVEIEATAVVPD